MLKFNHLDFNQIEGRLFTVGDIHGHFDLLERELEKVNFNRDTDYLISVGDLVDRGPQSDRALEFLKEIWFYAVRGNHEEMCNKATAGTYWHVANGGSWYNELDERMQNKFSGILTSLPLALEAISPSGRKIGFVHASVPPAFREDEMYLTDWNDMQELVQRDDWMMDENELLWDRYQVSRAKKLDQQIMMNKARGLDPMYLISERKMREFNVANVDHVYLGHTPMAKPLHIGNMSWIDTGAFATGNLTVLEVE